MHDRRLLRASHDRSCAGGAARGMHAWHAAHAGQQAARRRSRRGRAARAACTAIGGMGTEEISEWLQGGSCSQSDLHA